MWETLKKVHGALGQGRLNFLKRRFFNYKTGPTESIDDVCSNLSRLQMTIKDIKEKEAPTDLDVALTLTNWVNDEASTLAKYHLFNTRIFRKRQRRRYRSWSIRKMEGEVGRAFTGPGWTAKYEKQRESLKTTILSDRFIWHFYHQPWIRNKYTAYGVACYRSSEKKLFELTIRKWGCFECYRRYKNSNDWIWEGVKFDEKSYEMRSKLLMLKGGSPITPVKYRLGDK